MQSLKARIIELLPYHPPRVIADMLGTTAGYASKIKTEYQEQFPEKVFGVAQGKTRKPRYITEEDAKLYHDHSLTAYEITRLLDMSYPTAVKQMAMHGYRPTTIVMRSQINVIDRRAWLVKVGYSFSEAKMMQPDYVDLDLRVVKKKTVNERVKELAIRDGKQIVERNPFLYRKWCSV